MATIVTRSGKGSPLTNTEVDANFTNLNTDKAELSGANFTGSIDVTGSVVADGLTVDGTGFLSTIGNNTQQIRTYVDADEVSLLVDGSARLDLWTGGSKTLRLASNGDISFYNDSAAQAFFWDSSTSRLGLGTTNPSTALDLQGGILSINDGTGLTYYEGVKIHSYDTNGFDIIGREGLTLSTVSSNKNIVLSPTGSVNITSSLMVGSTTAPTDNLDISLNNNNGGKLGLQIHNTNTGTVANFAGMYATAVNGTVGMRVQAASLAGLSAATFGSTTSHPARFVTADVERLRINADGSSVFSGAVTTGGNLKVYTAGYPQARLGISDSNYFDFTFDNPTDTLKIGKNGSAKVTVGANGNVNVYNSLMVGATTAPEKKLTIASAQSDGIQFNYDSSNNYRNQILNYWNSSADSRMDFNIARTSGQTPVTIMSVGYNSNVGIGTNLPSSTLHIKTSVDNSVSQGLIIERSANTDRGYINYQGGGFQFRSTVGDPIVFGDTSNEQMRLTSTGLGIGAAPSAPLTVSAADGTLAVFTNASNADFQFKTASGVALITPSTGTLAFGTSNTERMRIDSSGNIQQGNYSDTTIKNFNMRSTKAIFNIAVDGTTNAVGTTLSYSWVNGGQGPLKFSDASGERMRIDSSGNLLVGTTDTTLWNDNADNYGHNILGHGQYYSSTNGEINAYLNRQNSDGAILAFAKDGSPVGSIGYGGGGILYNAASNYGLKFYDAGGSNIIHPATTAGGDLNGSVDLGYAGSRFKDLYLSSGVYLGGTGAANKLSDFETGSFTPTLGVGSGSITYAARLGTYTKVGRLVNCTIAISLSAVSSPSGTVSIFGLPFTNSLGEGYVSAISVGIARNFASALEINGYVNNNASTITLGKNPSNTGHENLVGGDLTSSTILYISIAYHSA